MLGGCDSLEVEEGWDPLSSLCGPQGTRKPPPQAWEARNRHKTSAAHRSAAMAGGARPDPFRTRKLSRRAPMVLRGQPVGEQGAADRWTALDPYIAGSGAGASPPRRPLSLLSISFSRGPRGALFHAAGSRDRAPHPLAACLRAGRSHPCRQRGRTAPSPRARGLRAHAAPGGPPVHGGGAPGSAPSGGRPARRGRSRRHPARASLPAPGARRPDRAPGRVLRAP